MITPDTLRAAFPAEGLFAEKDWLLSPEPLPLSPALARELAGLGHRLRVFLQAADALHHRSAKGRLPAWIAATVDAGKPAALLAQGGATALRGQIPRVLRPDLLLLDDDALALSELDSVPGGIGLTAWLNQVYAPAFPGLIGGSRGQLDGFASIFPASTPADFVVSQEAVGYRPEMEWLAAQLGRDRFRVCNAEDYAADPARAVYRFFELFDLPNLPAAGTLLDAVASGTVRMTAPPKPWLEEKAWLALFWLRPLRELWRRELSDNQQQRLEKIIPYSWLVDPTPLPPHAVLPRLEVNSWDEVAAFSQKQRELVLKRSGFHEEAWGARSVVIGHDVAQPDWAAALRRAQTDFRTAPWVLQEFKRARVVEHPYFDPVTGAVRTLRGRVRLCPYYFISAADESITLGGILATIVPEDKKIIHGMKDAILVPCRVADTRD
jgi:hypothetical protein